VIRLLIGEVVRVDYPYPNIFFKSYLFL